MTSGSQPPGEVGRDAHSLIRLRERTEYQQLTDVPSDLRVNGARHASRESLPPSKPSRPQMWCVAAQVNSTRGRAAVRASAMSHCTATRLRAPHGAGFARRFAV